MIKTTNGSCGGGFYIIVSSPCKSFLKSVSLSQIRDTLDVFAGTVDITGMDVSSCHTHLTQTIMENVIIQATWWIGHSFMDRYSTSEIIVINFLYIGNGSLNYSMCVCRLLSIKSDK